MKQENKVKLLKVLAFPASAAFMLGVGTMAICAEETDATPNSDTSTQITPYTNGSGEQESIPEQTDITPIDGDMYVDSESNTTTTVEKKAGDTADITGVLDTSTIVKQLEENEAKYTAMGVDPNQISVSQVQFYFNGNFQIPEGISLVDSPKPYLFTQGADDFAVTSFDYDNSTRNINYTFALKDTSISMYNQIKDIVKRAGTLSFTVHTKIDSDVAADTILTTTGFVSGHFSATASLGRVGIPFTYDWCSVQTTDKADNQPAANNQVIQASIKVVNSTTPDQPDSETPEQPETPKEEETTPSNEETSATETKKTSVKATKTNSVQTGVKTEMAGMISLMGLSLAGLVATKKRKDNE